MRRWLIVISAAIIPGSGHVILGRPMRGLVFLFWMVIFGDTLAIKANIVNQVIDAYGGDIAGTSTP